MATRAPRPPSRHIQNIEELPLLQPFKIILSSRVGKFSFGRVLASVLYVELISLYPIYTRVSEITWRSILSSLSLFFAHELAELSVKV